jgi:hypothetical protein
MGGRRQSKEGVLFCKKEQKNFHDFGDTAAPAHGQE